MRGRRLTTPPLEALLPCPPPPDMPLVGPASFTQTAPSSPQTGRLGPYRPLFQNHAPDFGSGRSLLFLFLYHYFYPGPSLFSAILYLSYFFFWLCFVFIVIPLPFFSSFYCVSGNKVILARLCAAMVVCFDVKSVPCRLLECKGVVTPANTCGRCLRGFFSAPVTLAIQKLHADMFDGYTLTMRNEHA